MQENGILFGVIGYWSSFPVMKYRKLSQPWHGLYRIMDLYETDITVQKVYQPSWRTADSDSQEPGNTLKACRILLVLKEAKQLL